MEGWVYICSVLLVAAGFAKIRDPEPTRGALAAASIRLPRSAVVGLGGLEIVAGAVAVIVGGPVAAGLVALLYAGFAGFVMLALTRSLPLQSCGCFGREDTPPSVIHVVANLAAAIGAAVAAVTALPSIVDVMSDQPLAGVPYAAFVAIGAATLYLLLTELPRLNALASGTT